MSYLGLHLIKHHSPTQHMWPNWLMMSCHLFDKSVHMPSESRSIRRNPSALQLHMHTHTQCRVFIWASQGLVQNRGFSSFLLQINNELNNLCVKCSFPFLFLKAAKTNTYIVTAVTEAQSTRSSGGNTGYVNQLLANVQWKSHSGGFFMIQKYAFCSAWLFRAPSMLELLYRQQQSLYAVIAVSQKHEHPFYKRQMGRFLISLFHHAAQDKQTQKALGRWGQFNLAHTRFWNSFLCLLTQNGLEGPRSYSLWEEQVVAYNRKKPVSPE